MNAAKDSPEVVAFMGLFGQVRERAKNASTPIEELLANGDKSFLRICTDLSHAASVLRDAERSKAELYSAPVNPRFISMWREYEDIYERHIALLWIDAFLLDIFGPDLYQGENGRAPLATATPSFESRWLAADDRAKEQATALEGAMDHVERGLRENGASFHDECSEEIKEGISFWKELCGDINFDIRGIMRRRQIIPFTLIPSHVAKSHGESEKLSLYTLLGQAHSAFIFGIHFAALALMRSILELTLRKHYGAFGRDLNELIRNCGPLPRKVNPSFLHRIRIGANSVLHSGTDESLPADFEKELCIYFYVLRTLIEFAPNMKSHT